MFVISHGRLFHNVALEFSFVSVCHAFTKVTRGFRADQGRPKLKTLHGKFI